MILRNCRFLFYHIKTFNSRHLQVVNAFLERNTNFLNQENSITTKSKPCHDLCDQQLKYSATKIHRMSLFSSPVSYSIAGFHNESEYEEKADETLDLLSEQLEAFLDQLDNKSYDIVFNNGVITLSLGDHGTYVINKQTPNRQIWLSSPISGPKRYDYIDDKWIYKHDGQSLQDLLKSELEKSFQINVDLE